MNWVEHRIKKEAAISAGSNALWQELAMSIKSAVTSYNEHYGTLHGKVRLTPNGTHLSLTRDTRTTVGSTTSLWHVELDTSNASISGSSKNEKPKAKTPVSLHIDLGNPGEEPLLLSLDGKTLTLDEASRVLIEGFLFNPEFYATPL